jgi:hypothetical protein
MAIEQVLLTMGGLAAADLSAAQFKCVVLSSTNTWDLPKTAITAKAIGILQNAPKAGEECVVALAGISKAWAATSLANNVSVAPEWVSDVDSGKVIACATTQYPLGIVVFPADAEDDLCSVFITPIHKTLTEDL